MKFARLPACLLLLTLLSCQQSNLPEVPEGFQIEEGFTLTRVAAEPLIKDPVDLEFNERGDAFVLEMPGYPFEDRQSRLLVLRDMDQDGIYDSSVVFIDGLQLANSFMPYRKGMLVAAPPYLLYVRDENQDYIADGVDTLMGGFSTGNLQHNYNALTYGLDNWIYAANGGNDGAPYWWGDTTTRLDLRGNDFRFNLETRVLERLGESSGGYGLAVDPYDRIFETHNLEHNSHLVFPDRYIGNLSLLPDHTLQNISDHEENGLSRIYPVGEQEARVNHPEQSGYFSGACGITWYGGGAFGGYENTVWVADVVLNLIHVDRIVPSGASFTALRVLPDRDFLASTDRSFRPVNMTVGPDGSLFVVDMYREVIEHPEWIPDEIEKTLDLNAGKEKGRIYRISSKEKGEPFAVDQFSSKDGLLTALSHPNQWIRKTAHRLLMETRLSEETTLQLGKMIRGQDEFPALHALHILSAHGLLNPQDLRTALASEFPGIRETALSISEKFDPDEVAGWIIPLMTDENMRVRMQACLTISKIRALLPETSPHQKEIWDALVASAAMPRDAWTEAAITLAAGDEGSRLFSELVKKNNRNSSLLGSLALNAGRTAAGLQVILQGLNESGLSIQDKHFVLRQTAKHTIDHADHAIESRIQQLEASPGATPLLAELARLRVRLNLPASPQFIASSKAALQNTLDYSLPDSVRLEQLSLIELLPYGEKSEVLFACLENHQPLKIQEEALRQLSGYQETEIGWRITAAWNELSPQTRRYASDLLLYREIHHDALLTALENGTINIGEMNFDLERRRMLLYWTDNERTNQRAANLFTDAGVTNREQAIEQMRPALELEGSALRGEKVFESICSSCHVYGEIGLEVGPVLTEINRKSKETLLHDILDPNAAVDPGYIHHRLETNEGQVHMGIVTMETDEAITIQKIGGEKVTVAKDKISSFRSLGTSLMMEGLENSMSVQEMADLLAFLQEGTP